MMTEGAGGGTVCSAALYYDRHEVVEETLNIKFLEAAEALLKENLTIHAMTDVTGFGLLGHTVEMAQGAGLTATIHADALPPGARVITAGAGFIADGEKVQVVDPKQLNLASAGK